MYHHKNAKLAYWYVLVNHGLMSGRMLNVIFGVLMAMLFCSCRNDKRSGYGLQPRAIKERFRPMPICSPILFPTPHALVTLSCSFIIFLIQNTCATCYRFLCKLAHLTFYQHFFFFVFWENAGLTMRNVLTS